MTASFDAAEPMGTTIYLNGQFVSEAQATVSLFDHGYLFGDGIFETLRAYDGVIFRLADHLDRFFDSARYLCLTVPCSPAELAALVEGALRKSELREAYLRVTLSRGVGERGIDPGACKHPTLSIVARELALPSPRAYAEGIATGIVSVRKTADAAFSSRVKSCNYGNNILAKLELNQRQLTEGFLLNGEGFLTEGTISNLFLVKRRVLCTPSLASGCLPGITRATVLELGRGFLDRVEERALTPHDLYTADEAFVTNTIMEIMPIATVDGRSIGAAAPGPVTRELAQRYRAETARVPEGAR